MTTTRKEPLMLANTTGSITVPLEWVNQMARSSEKLAILRNVIEVMRSDGATLFGKDALAVLDAVLKETP